MTRSEEEEEEEHDDDDDDERSGNSHICVLTGDSYKVTWLITSHDRDAT